MIIAIPITLLLIYLAKYYTLKHEYQELQYYYNTLLLKYREELSENEEINEEE